MRIIPSPRVNKYVPRHGAQAVTFIHVFKEVDHV